MKQDIEKTLAVYTGSELQAFSKGYLTAIEGILEQMQDDKLRILTRLLEIQGATKEKFVLQAKLEVLDAYEEHYKTRLHQLERDAE